MNASPLHPDGPGRRLSAINPDAGQHAIPERESDIARALRCSTAAWRRFPYLGMRYGARGRRFTSSDSCWLVSLYDHDAALVHANLQWLRTVLASRGLPTIILDDQLRKIDADVAEHEPERWQASSGFRTVLEEFQAQRDARLAPDRHHELVEHWGARFDACSGRGVPDAAALLISARLDTASGIARAWEATHVWFVDPQRFSGEWIACVGGLTRALDGVLGERAG